MADNDNDNTIVEEQAIDGVMVDFSTDQGWDDWQKLFARQVDGLTGSFFQMTAIFGQKEHMLKGSAALIACLMSAAAKVVIATKLNDVGQHDVAAVHEVFNNMLKIHEQEFEQAVAQAQQQEKGHLDA